jgi:hypothetical protein
VKSELVINGVIEVITAHGRVDAAAVLRLGLHPEELAGGKLTNISEESSCD